MDKEDEAKAIPIEKITSTAPNIPWSNERFIVQQSDMPHESESTKQHK